MDPKELRDQAIKNAKCQLILNAAQKTFAEKGYWEARLEDIAASVGFSKASLYNYYSDKEAIFLALAIRESGRVLEKIEAETRQNRPFLAAIEAMLRVIFNQYQEHFTFFVSVSNFESMMTLKRDMTKHPALFKVFHESFQRGIVLFRTVVERGKDAKEVSSRLDSATLALFIHSLVQSLQIRSWKMGQPIATEEAVSLIVEFVKNGVGTTMEPSAQ